MAVDRSRRSFGGPPRIKVYVCRLIFGGFCEVRALLRGSDERGRGIASLGP